MTDKVKTNKKPKDGAFLQQRLPAWQPIFTPKKTLPVFFILGVIFTPIGGLLYWNTEKAQEIMINYTNCDEYTEPTYLSSHLYVNSFPTAMAEAPTFYISQSDTFLDPNWRNPNNLSIPQCTIDFSIPEDMVGPIFLYYRLTNFYQNRRQYIKSYDLDQLQGSKSSECEIMSKRNEKVIYPCGMIANSMFNDTSSNLTSVKNLGTSYDFTTAGIAWPTDLEKYKKTEYLANEIVPPNGWAVRYPNGQYTDEYPPPDVSTMERLMVWMHVAALPDFRKLWARNDQDKLAADRWRIKIDSNFNTKLYGGTKWLVISNSTSLGGRNFNLAIAYIAIGGISIFLGLLFAIYQIILPRKLGDENFLSWNQPGGGLPKQKTPRFKQ